MPTVIKFYAGVDALSAGLLMKTIDGEISSGTTEITLLISTPGGNVFHGLSVFNYLKGAPITLTTHNFGSADSIGAIIYCAGDRRLCVPNSRFLLHPAMASFPSGVSIDEHGLEERLKALRNDNGNIAGVIAATIGETPGQVAEWMANRTTWTPEEAIEHGLTHEVSAELYPDGSKVIPIEFPLEQPTP